MSNSTQISGIEDDLYSFFRPIDPDPEFINTLNRRLGLGFLAGIIVLRMIGRK